MRYFPFRKISSIVFSKPNRILREINANSLMVKWSKEYTTENIFKERFELYEYVNSSILNSDRINFLEFGVFQGESLFKWSYINENNDSRFYGFDSFAGLPETWDAALGSLPKGSFDLRGRIPETNDKRIQFIKGLFQDTLRSFLNNFTPDGRLVIHIDCDIYSSTLYCLTMLDEILVKDSILIFDEFFCSSNEFQAFFDYSMAYRREYNVLAAVSINPYRQIAIALK